MTRNVEKSDVQSTQQNTKIMTIQGKRKKRSSAGETERRKKLKKEAEGQENQHYRDRNPQTEHIQTDGKLKEFKSLSLLTDVHLWQ